MGIKEGIDIYIDRDKEMMYIGINQKMTPEAQREVKESFSEIFDYKIAVFESINDIKFLN